MPTAADVLGGRARPTTEQLFELVHAVNPTGEDLPEEEARRRYDDKAALQSLLLREHLDDVRVVEDAGVLAIHHRYGPEDACHVPLHELDPDVRAVVQRHLDLGNDEAPVEEPAMKAGPPRRDAPADLAGLSAAELLREGHRRRDGWDLAGARHAFELALERRGGLDAASALVDLLVDGLGDFDAALAVELPPGAAEDETIMVLLGLAAAHLGEDVEPYLHGRHGPRVAEAHVLLAHRAVAAGDEARAAHLLALATDEGADANETARIEGGIEELRAAQRRPLEEEAETALDGGRFDEALARAEALLAKHPSSVVARRIKNTVEEQQRERRGVDLLSAGREALAGGDEQRALTALREAASLGNDEARAAAASLEVRRRAREDAAAVDRVANALARDLHGGLVAYLSLRPDLRPRLVGLGLDAELEVAEAANVKRPRDAAGAVVALIAARVAMDRGDPEAALRAVGPHDRVLSRVAAAAELRREAESRIEEAKRRSAAGALDAARAAVAAMALEEARGHLDAVDTGWLDAAQRQEADALRARLDRHDEVERLEAQAGALQAGGDLFAARDVVEQLVGEGPEWAHRLRDVQEAIQRQWRVRAVSGDGLDLSGTRSGHGGEGAALWLLQDGAVLLHSARDHWLFLWIVDAATGTPRSCAWLRTPRPMGLLSEAFVDGSTLWIAGESGGMVQLDLSTWDVLRWVDLEPEVQDDEILERVVAVPGTRFVWLATRDRSLARGRGRVYDVEAGRVRKDLGELFAAEPVMGRGEPRVFCYARGEAVGWFEPNGAVARDVVFPDDLRVTQVAPHPTRDGVIAVVQADAPLDEAIPIGIAGIHPGEPATAPFVIEASHEEASHELAAAEEPGLVFVVFHGGVEEGAELVALRPEGGGFEEVYRVAVPSDTVLAQDGEARNVVALSWTAEGVAVRLLTELEPRLPPASRRALVPRLHGRQLCYATPTTMDRTAEAVRTQLLVMTEQQRERWMEEYWAEYREDARRLLILVGAARLVPGGIDHRGLLFRALDHHPDDADVRLAAAAAEGEVGSWQSVARLLDGIDAEDVAEGTARHLLHLRGLARLHLGDLEGARRDWESAEHHEGSCNVSACLDVVRPVEGAPSVVSSIRAAIEDADEHLDAGRFEAAIGAVALPVVFQTGEVQALARLAAAWLETDGTFDRALALATFLHAHGEADTMRSELPVPGRWWDRARLDALARRCRQDLDGDDP